MDLNASNTSKLSGEYRSCAACKRKSNKRPPKHKSSSSVSNLRNCIIVCTLVLLITKVTSTLSTHNESAQPSQLFLPHAEVDNAAPKPVALVNGFNQKHSPEEEEEAGAFIMQARTESALSDESTGAKATNEATTTRAPTTQFDAFEARTLSVAGEQQQQQAIPPEDNSSSSASDQKIPIDVNRRQYVTHDQLNLQNLPAGTKDEIIHIANEPAQQQQPVKSPKSSSRSGLSKISQLSSLLSAVLFNGTPVETWAPLAPANADTNSAQTANNVPHRQESGNDNSQATPPPAPISSAAAADRSKMAAKPQAPATPQTTTPSATSTSTARPETNPISSRLSDNRYQAAAASSTPAANFEPLPPANSRTVYFLSSSSSSDVGDESSNPVGQQQQQQQQQQLQPALNTLAQPSSGRTRTPASQSFDPPLTVGENETNLKSTPSDSTSRQPSNQIVVLQTANGTFVHNPTELPNFRRPLYANWTDYTNAMLAQAGQRLSSVTRQPETTSTASYTTTTITEPTTTSTTTTTTAADQPSGNVGNVIVQLLDYWMGAGQPDEQQQQGATTSSPPAQIDQQETDSLDKSANATDQMSSFADPTTSNSNQQQPPQMNDRRLGLDLSFRQQNQQPHLNELENSNFSSGYADQSGVSDLDGLMTSDGASEHDNEARRQAKCAGYCTLPLFTMLCDSTYESVDCSANKKCCVINGNVDQHTSGSGGISLVSQDNNKPDTDSMRQQLACRGSCLPMYHSSLCTRPNELQVDAPGCLTNFVCCAHPSGTSQLDQANFDELGENGQHNGLGVTASESMISPSQAAVEHKDAGPFLADLMPPPPPTVSISLAEQQHQNKFAATRQRQPMPVLVNGQDAYMVQVTPRPVAKTTTTSAGGMLSHLYQMFKSNGLVGGGGGGVSKQRQKVTSPQQVVQPQYVSQLYDPHYQQQMQMVAGNQRPVSVPMQPQPQLQIHQIGPPQLLMQSNQPAQTQLMMSQNNNPYQKNLIAQQQNIRVNQQQQQQQFAHQMNPQMSQLNRQQQQYHANQMQQQQQPAVMYNQQRFKETPAVVVQSQQGDKTQPFNTVRNQIRPAASQPQVSHQIAHSAANGNRQPLVQQQGFSFLQNNNNANPDRQRQQSANPTETHNSPAFRPQHNPGGHFAGQQNLLFGASDGKGSNNNKLDQEATWHQQQVVSVGPQPQQKQSPASSTTMMMTIAPSATTASGGNRIPPADQSTIGDPINYEYGDNGDPRQLAASTRQPVPAPAGQFVHHNNRQPVRSQFELDPASRQPQQQQQHQVLANNRQAQLAGATKNKRPSTPAAGADRVTQLPNLASLSSNMNIHFTNVPFVDLQRMPADTLKPLADDLSARRKFSGPQQQQVAETNSLAPTSPQPHVVACPSSCITPTMGFSCARPNYIDERLACPTPGALCCVKVQPKQQSADVFPERQTTSAPRQATTATTDEIPDQLPPEKVDQVSDDAGGESGQPVIVIDVSENNSDAPPADESSDSLVVSNGKVQPGACGMPGPRRRATSGQARGRVMGGTDAQPGYWCWQAALMNNKNEYLCGGALIGPKWVLTAAHCVTQHLRSESPLFVRLGQSNLNVSSPNGGHPADRNAKTIQVKASYVHHNHNGVTLDNDVALLRLEEQADLSGTSICTICLPDKSRSSMEPGKRCTVTGYGFEKEDGPVSLKVRQTDLPIVTDGECVAKTSLALNKTFSLPANSFCAGGELGQDACHGDGGSPLSCLMDGYYELAGIVSWGYKCGSKDLPGLYSKVSAFVGWINQIVSVNN